MEVLVNNISYPLEIIKKNNKNTYIRVKDGVIIATTNYLCTKQKVLELIKENEKNISMMINHDKKRSDKKEEFYYFGKKYDIVYGFSDIEFSNNKIYVKDEKFFTKYIKQEISNIFLNRLKYWYNLFEEKIPVPNLKIRRMTTRWGVCNVKSHDVTLNYNLSQYDISCLDYVIVHELSHFIHPNHSKNFWFLVNKYYPRYKECRKMLKE